VKKAAKTYSVTVILTVLFALIVFHPLLAQAVDYTVGVKSGDWIKYGQFTVNWTGNGTEPSYITDEKKIDWARIDVENVSGTTVTLNVTTHYNNGTLTNQSDTEDVANKGMTGFFLIASNLKSGDRITNGTISPIVNQTTTGTYAGATRNVNLVNTTTTGYGNLTLTSRICWDQSTGIMVEAYTKAPGYESPSADENPSGYMEMSIKATETNMWSSDIIGTLTSNPIYIIVIVIIVIVVVVAGLIVVRRKQLQPPPPSQPVAPQVPPPQEPPESEQ
jgi:hypothetical protein